MVYSDARSIIVDSGRPDKRSFGLEKTHTTVDTTRPLTRHAAEVHVADHPKQPPRGVPPRGTLPDLSGSMIGRYKVLERSGRGGMGEVYKATDTLLRRDVAMKRVTPKSGEGSAHRRRILGEARRASKVNDPRIASVYDVLEHEDEIFIVMEYVEGPSLREILAERPGLDRFWDLAEDCVRALGVAHRAGLVHRDIKPENIMLTPSGQVKILDFGLAKRFPLEKSDETASTDSLPEPPAAGTPAYMAPEAYLGREPDGRTDIFSLGALFYEYLAGRRPFRGETYGVLAQEIVNEEPEPLLTVNPDVPSDLASIVSKMLAKDPDRRYQSSDELLRDLEAVRSGYSVTISIPRRPAAPSRRPARPAALIAAAGGLALLAVVYLFALGGWERITARFPFVPLPEGKHVAVLAMQAQGGGDGAADLAMGMTALLRDGLERLTAEHPLQVASLSEAIRERVDTPMKAREFLGANLSLETTVAFEDKGLEGEIRLVETATGRTLRRASVAGSQDPRSFVGAALAGAIEMLELPARNASPESLMALGDEGAGTLDFYLRGLGRLEAAQDTADIGKAIKWFRLADRTDPGSSLNMAGLARAYGGMYVKTRDDRWLAEGEKAGREAVGLDSARAGAHKALSLVLWDEGKPEEAVAEMRRAVDLDPTDDEAVIKLGRFYGRRGFVDEEEKVYRAAARARPHAWRPHFWLATKVYYEHGRFAEAAEAFAEMIRRAPDHHVGYESLGGLYVLEGEYDRAVEILRKAIALHPSAEALTNLGAAFFNLRDFEAAIETFNEVFRHEFVDYLVWLNLGDAYYWAPGRRDLAGRAYGQALAMGREAFAKRPYDFTIPANLAPVFLRLGEPDSGRIYLDLALASEPNNPMIQYSAALTEWQLGERDKAIEWLEKSVVGGYPVPWIRDSALFDDWRGEERFKVLVGETGPGETGVGETGAAGTDAGGQVEAASEKGGE